MSAVGALLGLAFGAAVAPEAAKFQLLLALPA